MHQCANEVTIALLATVEVLGIEGVSGRVVGDVAA